jgi:hypothetical protein
MNLSATASPASPAFSAGESDGARSTDVREGVAGGAHVVAAVEEERRAHCAHAFGVGVVDGAATLLVRVVGE